MRGFPATFDFRGATTSYGSQQVDHPAVVQFAGAMPKNGDLADLGYFWLKTHGNGALEICFSSTLWK